MIVPFAVFRSGRGEAMFSWDANPQTVDWWDKIPMTNPEGG